MKRIAIVLFFLTLLLYNGHCSADSVASIVIEESTGCILYESNAHTPLPMASTTKIMTALVALENASLEEVVTAGRNAFGVPGTSIYLQEGEALTLEQLLYGLMLSSGNDAAVAIAEHVAGSVEAFCDMMNARAGEIGCENTCFTTPHGLPAAGHFTTAYDLALISREAMKNENFREIVSTQRATIPWISRGHDRILTNKNRLLTTYEGAIGIKTGYTKAAGRCLSFAAERDGMTLVGVVLNCPTWFDDASMLFDQAFSEYEMKHVFSKGDIIAEIEVDGGTEKNVQVVAQSDVAYPMKKECEPNISVSLPQILPAGFSAGEIIGLIRMSFEGNTLLEVPIITKSAVMKRTFLTGFHSGISNWFLLSN